MYKKEDITNVIIPHFSKYPLQSRKRISYEYWCKIHNNILEKDYYDDQTKLIQYLKDLPKINSRPISKILLSKLSPEIIKVISEDREDSSSLNTAPNSLSCLNPNWVAGFTAGEGHFGVVISKREGRNPEVKLRFIITQKSDKILLERIRMTINCGKLSIRKMGEIYDLRVQDLDNIINKIIPFFDKYSLSSLKQIDFKDFQTIAYMVKNDEHLTNLDKINAIKIGMNSGRRKI